MAAAAVDDGGPVEAAGVEENTEKMAEYLWSNIDTVHYVKVPATLLLIIVVAYSCFGGLMLTYYESNWSFLHGLYFSVTSVLKVGFGDLLPTNRNFEPVSIAYILFGLIVATMCVDVVGLQYVHKIHQLGRVAQENADYLNVIQRAKYRKKKREALKTLFGMLTIVNRASVPSA
uniref:Potassium channel domain-containing protein n=1 Tax=Romanomermis culicivorax TaxID=13658 RepID=A0A915ISV5_ROMCU